jgi:thiol-disulfide isomerase/thioredoxin
MKGSRNSLKMSNDKMMVCGVVVVLILVGLYFLVTNNNLLEGFDSAPMELNHITSRPNPGSNDVVLMLFYVEWCPHCVSAKPEWAKLVEAKNGSQVNGKNVTVAACNCEGSEVEQETARDNNVQGYPTIKCIKNGETVDYEGARTFDALSSWVESMCA